MRNTEGQCVLKEQTLRGPYAAFGTALENVLIIAGLLAAYMPWDGSSLLIAPALVVAWIHREQLDLDPQAVKAVLWLAAWMLAFCLISDDVRRSAKGAYDMVRAALVFFPALLLSLRLREGGGRELLLVIVAASLAAHFLFSRANGAGTFFGFHANPNNVAVALVAFASLWLASWPHRRAMRWLWAAVGVVALVLLVLTNGRGAWLGVGCAVLAWTLFAPHLGMRARVLVSTLVVVGLVGLLLLANYKGFGATHRLEIWSRLMAEAAQDALWFGHGLNVVKEVTIDLGLNRMGVITAHNLFLEVFVSTGAIGSLWFLAAASRLVWALSRQAYARNAIWWAGVMAIIAFVVMGMFDLKLASFRFIASMAMFLGLLYGQRLPAATRAS